MKRVQSSISSFFSKKPKQQNIVRNTSDTEDDPPAPVAGDAIPEGSDDTGHSGEAALIPEAHLPPDDRQLVLLDPRMLPLVPDVPDPAGGLLPQVPLVANAPVESGSYDIGTAVRLRRSGKCRHKV